MDYEALINHEIITFDKQAYPLKNIYRMLNFINGINGYVKEGGNVDICTK